MAKLKAFSRIVYGLVGIAGLWGAILPFTDITIWLNMNLMSQIAYVLVMVGAVNWGVIALSGDSNKDLIQPIQKLM